MTRLRTIDACNKSVLADMARSRMNAPATIQPDARRQKLVALRDALDHLINVESFGLKPMNPTLLWAEWHYAKADHELNSTDDTTDAFQCACDNLEVDHDGNPLGEVTAPDGTTWGRAA